MDPELEKLDLDELNDYLQEIARFIRKVGAPGMTQAVCNSILDTQSVKDSTEFLKFINEGYDRHDAIIQIRILMDKYKISELALHAEIANSR